AREIAKNVTETVIGKKKLGSEFGTGTWELLGLFDGGSRARRFEGRGSRRWRKIVGGFGGIRVWIGIGIGGGERTVA
ncbi:hypothetical protein A2U01_0047538, partial [Trifolium medium]|nr:hypothetical protein [Trifolium medium]